MVGALLIIPLVAFVIPLILVLGALVFDAAFVMWLAYGLLHDHAHARWSRLLHRPV